MVHAAWNLRRYSQLQEEAWETLMQQAGVTSMAPAFVADSNGPKVIDKLFRYTGSPGSLLKGLRRRLHGPRVTRPALTVLESLHHLGVS